MSFLLFISVSRSNLLPEPLNKFCKNSYPFLDDSEGLFGRLSDPSNFFWDKFLMNFYSQIFQKLQYFPKMATSRLFPLTFPSLPRMKLVCYPNFRVHWYHSASWKLWLAPLSENLHSRPPPCKKWKLAKVGVGARIVGFWASRGGGVERFFGARRSKITAKLIKINIVSNWSLVTVKWTGIFERNKNGWSCKSGYSWNKNAVEPFWLISITCIFIRTIEYRDIFGGDPPPRVGPLLQKIQDFWDIKLQI